MKPYQAIPIADCGEPLVPIPLDQFSVEHPHAYLKLGAPYGHYSPYYLRQGVLDNLLIAQTQLQANHPGWQIQIFDAYRPLAVQQFMVDYTFNQLVKSQGLAIEHLTAVERQVIWQQVHQFWAVPSTDATTPSPHSTGAAVDVTLVDAAGQICAMGSPIDEISPRSYPQYFSQSTHPLAQQFHRHRLLLANIMHAAGFKQHPHEWWHFSYGDQMWAWLLRQEQMEAHPAVARYGAVLMETPGLQHNH
ncbi:MAG: D-alanyl-D-alanine dipeptidase [Cyanothece sp. SIO1E1]|nr:D-alanyl-D-alanine dipeptidase [Cyanothece sp. SIO1E1]